MQPTHTSFTPLSSEMLTNPLAWQQTMQAAMRLQQEEATNQIRQRQLQPTTLTHNGVAKQSHVSQSVATTGTIMHTNATAAAAPMDCSLTPRRSEEGTTSATTTSLTESNTLPLSQLHLQPSGLSVSDPWQPFPTPFEGNPPNEDEDEYGGGDGYDYGHVDDGSYGVPAVYLKEMELSRLLATIRDHQENWWIKVNQPRIVNQWKREIYQQSELLTPKTVEYGIQELKYLGQLYQQQQLSMTSAVHRPFILPSSIDRIWQTDNLITPGLLNQLKASVQILESVPVSERDYHPGNENHVINLIHPSLYCLRIGQTKLTKEAIPLQETLRSIGSGVIVSEPPKDVCFDYAISKKYAWLPSEFEISSDGASCTIKSYINNLHPIQHQHLYGLLEQTFAPFVPLFEKVLTDLRVGIKPRIPDYGDSYSTKPKKDDQAKVAFHAHIDREREVLQTAAAASSNGRQQSKFYLDVVSKVHPTDPSTFNQYRAVWILSRELTPRINATPSARNYLVRLQDHLASLYLETTFEAYTKTSGLLEGTVDTSSDRSIVDGLVNSKPPFVGLYLPPHILKHMSELIRISLNCVTNSLTNYQQGNDLGVFEETIQQKWFPRFLNRLPTLFPQLDPTTRQRYIDIFLTKEYCNVVRLGGFIQYILHDLLRISGPVGRRMGCDSHTPADGVEILWIELRHIQTAINNDFEFHTLCQYLDQRYNPLVRRSDEIDESNESEAQSTKSIHDTSAADGMDRDVDPHLNRSGATTSNEKQTGMEVSSNQDVPAASSNIYGDEGEDAVEDVYQPEVIFPFTPESRFSNANVSLAGRTLQVIVQLQTIELTPEKPTYAAEEGWHVDGLKNESIVASGLYCLNSTNLTDLRLSFNQAVDSFPIEDGEQDGVKSVYGITSDLVQNLGEVTMKNGRAIVWPNIYLKCDYTTHLIDRTQPGRRQLLYFFLVDPAIRVTSTAHVPPQQQHWLKTATGDQIPTILSLLDSCTPLIPDLTQLIGSYYSSLGVIPHSLAVKCRTILMKERAAIRRKNKLAVYEREYFVNGYDYT